ncbi:hypothetical protein K437DRAFT_178422 [Tilletiaria anomala UBC 951]|uniref:Metaxin glutathione S-transferase domain-containing protein n=1 Tax=Tilletiaria anomala (strain ATCC 24038 / CBS 436.72 / UBC 951) TaxID=1037660 RepID=A0A066VI18_TILAU|nr:uncharacterized protein K437DRAFT_178422 [Tilletiaria anomala UBC 951]KDN41337.1 hypothetical protein K437DRAFT_178422 [Tilletiaria anomala UBC 951]
MATEAARYPDFDSLPSPAGADRTNANFPPGVSTYRIPSWAKAVFARFPLHEWPEAEVHDASHNPPPSKPVLYVAQGHPRRSSPSVTPTPARGWASSDPRCLRWQMSLIFRGVDFETEQLQERSSWGPDPANQMPFLHLPPSYQAQAALPSTSRSVKSLVAAQDLPMWSETNAPWNRDKVEIGPRTDLKGKGPARLQDEEQQAESEIWTSLLETKVMAGVLLQRLVLPDFGARGPRSAGALSSLLHTHLLSQQKLLELRRIDALSSDSSSLSRMQTKKWSPWGMLSSALSNVSFNGSTLGGEAEEEDASLTGANARNVDADSVLAAAVEALEAFAARVAASAPEAEAVEEGSITWLLGRPEPGELDALAFALLHTILSLPVEKDINGTSILRACVERSPALSRWTRQVWAMHVKPRGG